MIPAVQLQNLIPFASVSAEDSFESCDPMSADPSSYLTPAGTR